MERLDWLAKNPHYTQRFALQVGKLCRSMMNKDVEELWSVVELSYRGMGQSIFREVERGTQVAAPHAIPEICRNDRASLGRDRL
ncbi:MAG: hypothetical protein ABIE74_04265, partial [Pseudomonadota bacterium]